MFKTRHNVGIDPIGVGVNVESLFASGDELLAAEIVENGFSHVVLKL